MRIAVRLSEAGNEADAQVVIRICQVMQAGEDRLAEYGDEVKAGRIERKIPDCVDKFYWPRIGNLTRNV